MKTRHRGPDQRRHSDRRRADGKMPALGKTQVRQVARSMAQFGLDGAGVERKRPAETCRYNPPTDPRQQLDVESFLELAHRPRQGWLRHVERPRRSGDAAMIDHGEQIEHLAYVEISNYIRFNI